MLDTVLASCKFIIGNMSSTQFETGGHCEGKSETLAPAKVINNLKEQARRLIV